MIAKVIAHADTRTEALDKLARALDETIVAGPRTNLAFLGALCRSPDFRDGKFDTGYIAGHHDELGLDESRLDAGAAARGALHVLARVDRQAYDDAQSAPSPWEIIDGFQLSGPRKTTLPILVNGEPDLAVLDYAGGTQRVTVHGAEPDMAAQLVETPAAVYVLRSGRQTLVALRDFEAAEADHGNSDGVIRAPMHGKLLAILVAPGETVAKGHRLAVIEAMKMEHALVAPRDGVVGDVTAEVGTQLAEGARIMSIEPAGTDAA
jgi:3-methylcrotonyl-CoA carboxylase alpha subunit